MSSAATLIQLAGPAPQSARDDVEVTRVRMLDTWAWAACRHDQVEVQRRQSWGLGAVLGWGLLDTLMELPSGLPVPVSTLTWPARRRVAGAPAGVVRICGTEVTRELVPAVMPLLVIVTARDWMDGLTRASRFAPYTRRMVLGRGLPVEAHILDTAARLGIGMAVQDGRHGTHVALEPEPVLGWQPTTAWWRFCEVIYGQATAAR
jgi:hypothetical protein